MTYRIEFERIGRNHAIAPLIANGSADDITDAVHKYARKHLRSSDYDVDLSLERMNGSIICGMHIGGRFTIHKEDAT